MPMLYPIVNMTENVISPGAAITLQQTVYFVSYGATTTATGTVTTVTSATSASSKFATNSWLTAAMATFFAQGTGTCYILELGTLTGSNSAALELQTWINANPLSAYVFVISAAQSTDTNWTTVANNFANNTSYTYFLLTLSISQAAAITAKSVIAFTQAAAAPATEFSAASLAYSFASTIPSNTALIRPWNYSFLYGVTPYASASSGTVQALSNSNSNIVIPATAGGLNNNMLLGGQTADGNAISLWYGSDYAGLNLVQALNNAIIEGSNNSPNPLYYSQSGINTLVAACHATLNSCVGVGAILGNYTISYIDFAPYVTANPQAYQAGTYSGIVITVVPTRGFNQISFTLDVDFTGQTITSAL